MAETFLIKNVKIAVDHADSSNFKTISANLTFY